nr:hypothetical protein [Pseudomonas syringae]
MLFFWEPHQALSLQPWTQPPLLEDRHWQVFSSFDNCHGVLPKYFIDMF